MMLGVSKNIAQNIVETVKEFCGYDINFINTDGYIFASTDPQRIGDFHEIGKQVADSGKSIEVYAESDYMGTHPGINTPFYYEGEVMAVIGITGEPDKVRQYSELAYRVTNLILKENDFASKSMGQQAATNYIIRSLINGEPIKRNHFNDFMGTRDLPIDNYYRTAIIQINSRYNPANIYMIEKDIIDAVSNIPLSMYRFQYPDEYVLIFETKSLVSTRKSLQKLLNKYEEILQIAIGSEDIIFRQNRSYESAILALKSSRHEKTVALYEEFDLELLLGSLGDNVSERYLNKTIGSLSQDEIGLLKVYYDANMSLKETSERLYIHKNTLQYKLDKIYEKSTYNPRSFHDACILYMALQLQLR